MPSICPDCQKNLERIQRKSWMRYIPGTKHYLCKSCGYSFMLIFNRWLLRRRWHHHSSIRSR
jgi:hypothetical protein